MQFVVILIILLVAGTTIINECYKLIKNRGKLTVNGCVSLYGSLIGGVWGSAWFDGYPLSTTRSAIYLLGIMFLVSVFLLYRKDIALELNL